MSLDDLNEGIYSSFDHYVDMENKIDTIYNIIQLVLNECD